ncbi:MAG: hypothetical protein ABH868_03205, partial [bacterium]
LGLRVDSDKKPQYKGSFFVDNVRLGVLPADKIKKLVRQIEEEELLFGFEEDIKGWNVPDWAKQEKGKYIVEGIAKSNKFSVQGEGSLEVKTDFPGGNWTAAYLEHVEYLNWGNYSDVLVDIYLPKDAPEGLKSKIILIAGKSWEWTEMKRPVRLVPGEWTTVRASLMPGSTDWKGIKPDDEFRMDVRNLAIRVDSDKKPVYKGSFYIDNLRLGVLPGAKASKKVASSEKVVFGFEDGTGSWGIPDWAWGVEVYVAEEIYVSDKYASEGANSLKVKANFPGKRWTTAYVENIEQFDCSDSCDIAVDIYIPEGSPAGLVGKIILAVGEEWRWTEMIRPVRLVPGEWTTVRASLLPGSIDWQGGRSDEDFRAGIRKIGIRVDSDKSPVYKGDFYIDNIRLSVSE